MGKNKRFKNIHTQLSRPLTSVVACIVLALLFISPQTAHAAGSSIFVTPNSGSYQPGQTFTLQVKGIYDSGNVSGTNGIEGTLTFPKNIVNITNISWQDSSFSWQNSAAPDNATGKLTFKGRSLGAVRGNLHVMSITFKTIGTGTAAIDFSDASYTTFSNLGSPTRSGGRYTINAPAAPTPSPNPAPRPSSPPTPSPNPAPRPSSPPTPSPGIVTPSIPDTPAPIPNEENAGDDEFKVDETLITRSYKQTSISWITNIPSRGALKYGSSLKNLDQTSEVTLANDGSFTTTIANLIPGKQYYFTITATSEADPTKTATYSGVFTTKGFPASVTVTENSIGAGGAKLKIGEQTYSTDRSGSATLELASGNYTVVITTRSGASKTVTLSIADKPIVDGETPETQEFNFDLPAPVGLSSNTQANTAFTIVGIIGGISLVASGGLFLLIRRKFNENMDDPEIIRLESDQDIDEDIAPLPVFPEDGQFDTAIPSTTENYVQSGQPIESKYQNRGAPNYTNPSGTLPTTPTPPTAQQSPYAPAPSANNVK